MGSADPKSRGTVAVIVLTLALVAATFLAYAPLRHNEFITFDDGEYITQNEFVRNGLTSQGIDWAFNVGYAGNWHPLTWFSHMLDVSAFGLDPWAHHRTNLLLHAANAVLMFLLFRSLTGAIFPSAFVAAVFALHPQHVESVAWAAERKDVLSTCFGLLALCAWLAWTRRAGKGRYLLSLGLFALGLAAKPMLVTLPFVMLLLDFWPLGRLWGANAGPDAPIPERSLRARLVEKIPFFALVAISCAVTLTAQARKQAIVATDVLPLDRRIANAALSCVSYLKKALLPTDLAIYYPYALGEDDSTAPAALCWLVVAAVTVFLLLRARRFPWIVVGWLWWIGTLVPVIGIVQVGGQAMADRYAYIPLIGLSIAVVWGVAELAKSNRTAEIAAAGAGVAALVVFGFMTRAQVARWRDSYTLFHYASQVTDGNYVAHNVLGYTYLDRGRIDEAIEHYELAVRFAPEMGEAFAGYGAALIAKGRFEEAVERLTRAIELTPKDSGSYLYRGQALLSLGRVDEAVRDLQEGVRLRPGFAPAQQLLDQALQRQRSGSAGK